MGAPRISRYLDSADTRSTLAAVAALGAGVEIEATGDEAIDVAIDGLRAARRNPAARRRRRSTSATPAR